ncbi:MAG: hypothetical protein C5B49_11930 [Bdellovibrio sp.]|nr:MAG: hypothetical protein C5B49_11930 [Bdellovibrio sp.]
MNFGFAAEIGTIYQSGNPSRCLRHLRSLNSRHEADYEAFKKRFTKWIKLKSEADRVKEPQFRAGPQKNFRLSNILMNPFDPGSWQAFWNGKIHPAWAGTEEVN